MNTESIYNIFIVDDHQLVIDGISSLIKGSEQFRISGSSTNPLEVSERLRTFPSDILLTDISMPAMNGIELTRLLKKDFPDLKVIAISMHGENQIIKEMLDAGISGYILKNTGKHELIEAIAKVAAGGTYFDENVTREILNSFSNKNDEKRLTPREIEIIRLIEQEYSNKQISEKLFISERTVESHRKNIFRKTNTQSLIGLMKYAYSMKLIQ
ncbi:MAG TPA: response regulator transcription factor [Daejeonella sp.]|uniref:response regulator transcription factor n=1 Tax=Daejeonella sp. TaxID=2805397 RepID=UPI002EDB26E7